MATDFEALSNDWTIKEVNESDNNYNIKSCIPMKFKDKT